MKSKQLLFTTFLILLGFFIVIGSCKKKDDGGTDGGGDNPPPPPPSEHGIIMGSLTNGVNLQPIASGLVMLVNSSGSVLQSVTASATGTYTITGISDGNYQVKVQKAGYKEMVADSVVIGSKNPKGNFVGLCPVETSFDKPVSALSGIILDQSSQPVSNATVSIAADPESLTNGYFSSVLTDNQGHFLIPAIPLVVGKGNIPAFKLRVMKDNYQISYSKGIVLQENRMKVRNFSLPPASGGVTVIFEETFENATNWIYTGFWHRQQNAAITNKAYPKYVVLAANDNSGGAIPSAYAGSYDAWFGEAGTGNFMGEQYAYDTDLSGGTGTTDHSGTLTSPPFTVTSSTSSASLRFWSWFEVESVNPNSSGYDIMEVMVLGNPDTTQVTSLGRLNPYSDPILDNRNAIPYTSGGFNIAPVWKFEQFDLSPFIGQSIRLRFEFRTIDEFYNGFRGWFIDNIRITSDAVKSSGIPYPVYPPTRPRK